MSKPDNTELAAHFDRLLDLYLERNATEDQKAELRVLTEQFADRFQAKFDAVINSELTGEGITDQTRQEILTNIFNRTPVIQSPELAEGSKGWRWMAAAAAIVICALGTWYFTTLNLEPATSNQQLSEAQETGPMIYSGKHYIKLTDGSTVLLTDSSQLTVSEDFNTNTRTVSLTGKAYFDIAHNPDKKFQILTGDVTTTVLGTAFSIDATNKNIEVTVTRGKVQVGDKGHIFGLLTRDQQMKVNLITKEFVTSSTNAEKATDWKKQYLIFDNVTMEVAAAIIYDKYNVKITYSTEAIKNCEGINADFISGESLDQVLEVISTLVRVKYKMLPDGNVLFEGEGCPAVP